MSELIQSMSIKQKDSVAKGVSSVALARIIGMAFSFLLFLLLARHSASHAAVFRTVMTYILIAESIGMMGMHLWLSYEIAPEHVDRWRLFLSANIFTTAFTIILSLVYLGIANAGIYEGEFNQAITLGALAVIPSGIYACVQSSMIGIGRSHLMGRLNMFENLTRCSVSIGLILMHQPVMSIVWVFVLSRWAAALVGFMQLKLLFYQKQPQKPLISWKFNRKIIDQISKEAPKFALITAAFVLLRNAGMLILPAYSSAIETATYAVSYQLFDLILVIPSVLAMTSTNVFANKAIASKAALKKVSVQLISISSLALFPLIAITAGFAQQFLHMFYGDQYIHGKMSLTILMLASGLAMIDQVLSQIMLARKNYRQDMVSNVIGAIIVLLLTLALVPLWGAIGAAFSLTVSTLFIIVARLFQLNHIFEFKLLWTAIWRQTLASLILYACIKMCLILPIFHTIFISNYLWIIGVPFAVGLYGLLVYFFGCLKSSQILRMRKFLFHD